MARDISRDNVKTAMLSSLSFWETFRVKVLGRNFVRNVGVMTAANTVGAVLSFVQGIVVARWLGPELYGVTALTISYPSLLYSFFDARSTEASVKYLSEFHAQDKRDCVLAVCKLGYILDFSIASVSFLVVAISAPWAARSINRPEVAWLIVIYAAAFIPRALGGASYAVLAVLGRFNLIALVEILTTVIRFVLVSALVLSGWQVAGVVWGNVIAMTATGLLYGSTALVLTQRKWGASAVQGKLHVLRERRREIFSFIAYTDLNALLGMIPKQLDVLLLGYFRGPAEAGYYKLARSLSGAVGYLVGPLQSVTYPDFARLSGVKDSWALLQRARRLALQLGLPLGIATLAGTSILPFVLPAMVGAAYLPAVGVAEVLLIGSAIWLSCFWLRPLYLAQGEVKFWTLNAAVIAILSLIGFAIIVPIGGAAGVAWVRVIVGGIGGHLSPIAYLLFRTKLSSFRHT